MIPPEILKLFDGLAIDFVKPNDKMHSECEFCQKAGSQRLFVFRAMNEDNECLVTLCETCAVEWRGLKTFEEEVRTYSDSSFMSAVSNLNEKMLSETDEDEFFAAHPEWRNYLQEFQAGHFVLDSGEEDELLKSISDQWNRKTWVSEKQIRAFIGRCSYYCEEKMKGNALTTPEDKRRYADVVEPLIEKADSIGDHFFGDAEKKKIDSLKRWYEKKKYLTINQVTLLVKTIKKAESRV